MVQPALMTALKPESVGRPPGVATMTPTAYNEVNVLIYNRSSHPGANRTGRSKARDTAPAPTIMAEKKRGSQTRLLSHDGNKKLRRTHRDQTRDTTLDRDISDEDQIRVTSQADMNVTPQSR